ncbi:MAG: hypothetical protein Q4D80_01835 [Pseudomonadota bacterium]|nr:hypothetical protein [Pseudomonadota bacterium]
MYQVFKSGSSAEHTGRTVSYGGRSMIEMLGVLAIIGVLSVGGIADYSKAMQRFKFNKWRQQIEDLIFSVKEAYRFGGRYGTGNENILPVLKDIGAVPQDMLDKNNKDLFGNDVRLVMKPLDIYNRLNLQFITEPNEDAVQVCHDLFYMAMMYPNDIWTTVVCKGFNCNGAWLFRICGKVAPKGYGGNECQDYNLTKVMSVCNICATNVCTL